MAAVEPTMFVLVNQIGKAVTVQNEFALTYEHGSIQHNTRTMLITMLNAVTVEHVIEQLDNVSAIQDTREVDVAAWHVQTLAADTVPVNSLKKWPQTPTSVLGELLAIHTRAGIKKKSWDANVIQVSKVIIAPSACVRREMIL